MKLEESDTKSWKASVTDFPDCTSGSIAIISALVIPVIFGAAMLTVDYLRISNVRSEMQSILDAAVLAGVQSDDTQTAETAFNKYIAGNTLSPGEAKNFVAQVDTFDGVNLTASASASVGTAFARIFGFGDVALDVTASGTRANRYLDLYFAVDMSSSTGVGATAADRAALEALTQPYAAPAYGSKLPQGCAFGCHRREGWEPSGKTVYQMAREAGIRLREDELNAQFNGLVDMLLDPNDQVVQNGMRKIGVTGFSNNAVQLIAPTSSAASVKSVLQNFPDYDRFETYFANALDAMRTTLGTQGNGSASNPRKMLILITDGIESRDAFLSQRAMDVSLCNRIKADGFNLAVVEIKYPKLTLNSLYDDTVLPVETTISPALQQCASPGWYFQAVNNADVPVKFNELKTRILNTATHLTQ
ncbi:MAG: TadE/TadG family type IV pilus assembly protein [Hyphomicrobiaceae bacterium]